MTVYFMAGELAGMTPSDSDVIEVQTSGTYNSSFARCAIQADENANYFTSPSIANLTDVWLHFDIQNTGTAMGSASRQTIFQWFDSGFTQSRIRLDYHNLVLYLRYWDGSGFVDAGSTTVNIISNRQTIDIHVVCNSASGSAKVYIGGTLRIDSGTVDLSSFANLNRIRFHGVNYAGGQPNNVSQIVVASTSTIGNVLATVVMTGQGATHTFTTGGFANIDEVALSDADLINSGTANQVELFTGTPVASFTGYVIKAVAVDARAKTSGGAPSQAQLALRSAGTTYFSATKTLDAGYDSIFNVWETNPATSAAFLSSEIAALEYGLKSIT